MPIDYETDRLNAIISPPCPPIHALDAAGRPRCTEARATLNLSTYRASEVTCAACAQFLIDARQLQSPRPYDTSSRP